MNRKLREYYNHTTGGNFMSAVLNDKGEFIGVNFDRIWQGVVSDYRYNSTPSQAIAVDIRYIMSLFDKL
ncbi:MAG TPA: S46 family peptidase [Bacteroidales bacterium]|nr:S46 family peptidase [Bacteroidales bacterium]HRR49211.1 S46 family peptidase [Bacteroidales bacterium]HRT32946.1 S46 family peptidase [Bacteroidales bacterium]HRT83294.1 S46 family peptidase [Bacteroidales bacterium]